MAAPKAPGSVRAKARTLVRREEPLPRSSTEQLVAQQATLAHIGQLALANRSLTDLFRDACTLVGQVLDTELVALLELSADGDTLHLVEGVGWKPGVVGELNVYSIENTQSGYTIATGGPVIVPDLASEKRFKVWPAVAEHGAQAGMSVRIGAADKPFGALSAYTVRLGRFTRDEANFLQAVANVIAAAVERQRIEDELRTSRDQLAAIVGSINEGITVITPKGVLFANDAAAQLCGFANGPEMIATPPAQIIERFEMSNEDGLPLRPEDLPSRRAMVGEHPPETILGFRAKPDGDQRWSSVHSTPIRDLGGNVTHVITTFRDVTSDLWASQMQQFMIDATAVMSGTLDMHEAARRLADLAVPQLADYCTVDLLEPDGSVSSVALAHSDPDRLPLVLEARSRQHITTEAPAGPGKVIREGTPEMSEITLEMLEAANADEESIRVLKGLELRSYLTVPLLGRHGPIGALSLVMAHSGRSLGPRELALATELGVRAGVALENAQLYRTANDRRAQLDTVLAALEEAIIVYDGSGQLRLGNRAAAGVFEGTLPTTLDELWRRLTPLPGGRRPETAEADQGVEVAADDTDRWFELRRYGAPADAQIDGAELLPAPTVVVLRDVTESRTARAAREAFLGVLSHELRTPITTIYGGSQLLERGLDRTRRAEVISDIRAESQRLVRLVEDLLVMTRVERGIVETSEEPVLLQHLLAQIIAGPPARWGGAHINLHLEMRLPAVRGDATYIEQVVRNFLTNAVRYGQGGEKGIDVRAEQVDGTVAVRVQDHGRGLDGEEPARLFELFYRSENARSVPGGAGIGLFVSRNLVEAMGGHIWAVDRPEGGAEFGFTLPVLEPDSAL
ncbi:MAG TPA: ATP-binding protein [Candidatus Limnocylindria bacterium]|nr:ATP-binding protein [Candidatus Limnocylindria bacterium]